MKIPSDITLPRGATDILPDEAERISAVEAAALKVFRKYGFQRVITPLLEYVDVLSRGMDEELATRAVKFIEPSTGRVMAVRPDITPQIARVVATKMKDSELPLKLFYTENVVRYQDPGGTKSREILQVGTEWVSAEPSPETDAEMIVMAIEALKETGLREFKVDIGDVGFVKAVLDRLEVSGPERGEIKEAVARKDNQGLASLLDRLGKKVGKEDKNLLLALTTFYGEEEVIEKAKTFSTKDPVAAAALDNIESVLGIVASRGYKDYLTIDLGEVRGFGYYTGIIFEGFAKGVGKPVLGGGRYDTLIEKYGFRAASTGFALDVENIVSALGRRG
ncbi:MAG: ATP phosphoribosyltransferase regulatory subunit [Thermodesulfobacteriota bacterium]